MKLLTNDKLATMSRKAADEGNMRLVRLIDTARTYRTQTLEVVGDCAYTVSSDAAEVIVRTLWLAGKRARSLDALITQHGVFWSVLGSVAK